MQTVVGKTKPDTDEMMLKGDSEHRGRMLSRFLFRASNALDDAYGDGAHDPEAVKTIDRTLAHVVEYTHALSVTLAAQETAGHLMDKISTEDAREVLWWFGDRTHGQQPGSFAEALISATAKADAYNRIRMAQVFPGLVLAVMLVTQERGGMGALVDLIIDRSAE